LASLSGFDPKFRTQKTMLSNEGREVKGVTAGADKWVNKFVAIAKKKKEEIRARKAKEAADRGEPAVPDVEQGFEEPSALSQRKPTGYTKATPEVEKKDDAKDKKEEKPELNIPDLNKSDMKPPKEEMKAEVEKKTESAKKDAAKAEPAKPAPASPTKKTELAK